MIRFIKDEDGQGMLEYVLIIALVALVAVIAIFAVRTFLNNRTEQVESDLSSLENEMSTTA